MEHTSSAVIAPEEITAAAFDMDGVVTDTASVHAAAWKRTFDDFLLTHPSAGGGRYVPFALREDYLAYVDGRSRLDGVRTFLASRGITLPEEGPDAERLRLPGKPDPAVFLEAARRMGTPPGRTAVVEDSLAGVEAGVRGGFGLIIGVDRAGQAAQLYTRGAHVVVSDLAELSVAKERA